MLTMLFRIAGRLDRKTVDDWRLRYESGDASAAARDIGDLLPRSDRRLIGGRRHGDVRLDPLNERPLGGGGKSGRLWQLFRQPVFAPFRAVLQRAGVAHADSRHKLIIAEEGAVLDHPRVRPVIAKSAVPAPRLKTKDALFAG